MRRFFPLLFVLLGGAAAAQGPHDPTLMHQPSVRFELAADSVEIPMKQVNGHIIMDAKVNGKGPFPFLFDTGAHGSVLDLAFAREQGLELGEEVMVGSPGGGGRPGNRVTIGKLAIGGLTLDNMTSIAFEGLPFPRSETSPRGVIGPYGMKGLLVTLDYPGQRIVFRRGALPEPDGQEVFGWDPGAGLPLIPVEVAGLPAQVHLDSGSSGALSLPNSFADRLPLDGALVDMGYARLVDRVQPARGGRLKGDFVIGRYRIQNPMLHFVDMGPGTGNVGAVVLSRFALTIDPANTRLRLSGPADGRIQIVEEEKPRYGIQVQALEANPIQVLRVDSGSPAEKGGLKAGDRIVAVNGQPVGKLNVVDRLDALKASPLKVAVERGADTVEVSMTLE